MKKIIIATLFILVAIAAIFLITKTNEPSAKIIENFEKTTVTDEAYTSPISNDSTIMWDVKKVGGSHNGKIGIKTGFAIIQDNKIIGGEIILDMNSISVDDIEDPDKNQSLVDHLKNEDFFDTANHKTSTFAILEINETSIIGELTIKDFKNIIEVPAVITNTNNGQKITSSFSIDRTMRDIMYGSKNLASTLKDKAIDNLIDIQLTIKIE